MCSVIPTLFLLTIPFLKMSKNEEEEIPARDCDLRVVQNIGFEVKPDNLDTMVENNNSNNDKLEFDINYNNEVAQNTLEISSRENPDHQKGGIPNPFVEEEKVEGVLKNIFSRELWSNKAYVCYMLGVSVFLFGYFIPFVFMVSDYQ